MIASDIGVVDHALDRFKDYAGKCCEGVPDDVLEEEVKSLVLARFQEKKWTLHILDELHEAWLVRLSAARIGNVPIGKRILALVKGDDRNPGNHRVVVTFLDEDIQDRKFKEGAWQMFNPKKMIPRGNAQGLANGATPLTHKLGDQLKAALETAPMPETSKPSFPKTFDSKPNGQTQTVVPIVEMKDPKQEVKVLKPELKPVRLITYKDGTRSGSFEVTADKLSDCIEELTDQGISADAIKVWAPVKTKKRVIIEEE